jgi:hypothetical protein
VLVAVAAVAEEIYQVVLLLVVDLVVEAVVSLSLCLERLTLAGLGLTYL